MALPLKFDDLSSKVDSSLRHYRPHGLRTLVDSRCSCLLVRVFVLALCLLALCSRCVLVFAVLASMRFPSMPRLWWSSLTMGLLAKMAEGIGQPNTHAGFTGAAHAGSLCTLRIAALWSDAADCSSVE